MDIVLQMGPNTEANHPIVDLSGDPEVLKQGSKPWSLASEEIREAMEERGYFLVKYDAVSSDERDGLNEGMRGLFNLPVETKRRASNIKDSMTLYRGGYPSFPLYEAFKVRGSEMRERAEAFTNLMWPEGNDEFCDAMDVMSKKLTDLTRVLISMTFDGHGLGKHLDAVMETSMSSFNMVRYLAPETEELVLGLNEHTDPGYLTVLGQNEVAGLRVKTDDGDWVEVDPGKGYYVCFMGQAMWALTNGRLQPKTHLVSVRGVKERFSYGSFLSPRPEHTVDALPETVNDDCPRQFRPVVFAELQKNVSGKVDFLRSVAGI